MSFLASHWWLFLIVCAVFTAAAIANQIKRMKNMFNGSVFETGGQSFFEGIGLMLACGLVGTISFILFVVGVIANLVGR